MSKNTDSTQGDFSPYSETLTGFLDSTANIIIVGDIHLSYRGQNKEWEKERFFSLFNTIAAECPDIVILNGDIFDKAKITYDELSLFYRAVSFLESKDIIVYVIDGNHEEFSETTTIFDKMPEYCFTHLKYGVLNFSELNIDVCFAGHPYLDKIEKLAKYSKEEKKLLVSHYRSNIQFAKEEVSNDKISQLFSFTFLSDIHYPYFPKPNICYTSSPYSIHFKEEQAEYGYLKLTLNKDEFKFYFKQLDLPSKVKIKYVLPSNQPIENILKELLSLFKKQNLYVVEVIGAYNKIIHRKLSELKNIVSIEFIEHIEENYGNLSEELVKELTTTKDSSIDLVTTIEEFMDKETITNRHKKHGRPELKDCVL